MRVQFYAPFPNDAYSSALLNGGYKISRSHAFAGSLKTNAPRSFIHEVMRAWVKMHPVKMQNIKEGQVAHRLLAKELRYVLSLAGRVSTNWKIARKSTLQGTQLR